MRGRGRASGVLDALIAARYLAKDRYAEAMAVAPEGVRTGVRGQWAWYRLGMYRQAAALGRQGRDPRARFALAVSLAACGERSRAREEAMALVSERRLGKRVAPFLQGLAAFAPDLAESLLTRAALPRGHLLPLAVAIRLGDWEKARRRLEALRARGGDKVPDFLLMQARLETEGPTEQLAAMNGFLAAHGLAPVGLRDPGEPAGVMNLVGGPPREQASGDGPLVSVLMTTFRSGPRAVQAIDSLLAQHYRNLEVIVVDDGSGDDTLARVEAGARRDGRVRFLGLGHNVGPYVAKTVALQQARGAFVTCHDSDDWSHPEKIARQVRPLLENPALVATTSQWVRLQDDGHFHVRQTFPYTRHNPSSPLFRREVVDEMGAWDWVRTGADSEFLARMRLVFGRGAVHRVRKPLAFGAHRPDSLMTAPETGYTDDDGMNERLVYWEGWNRWHIDSLARGRPPVLPRDLRAPRAFPAPASILVDPEDVHRALGG